MKTTIVNLSRLIGSVFFGLLISCNSEDLSSDCFEGIIANDTIYRTIYNDCYKKAMWIEVTEDSMIGRDIEIFTASPGPNSNSSVMYRNVIEVPLTSISGSTSGLDTLLGAKIYFRYRNPTDSEKNTIRNSLCAEVYNTYDAPLVILTHMSFSECPQISNN